MKTKTFDPSGKRQNVYIPKNESDDLQPQYLFTGIATDLLVAIVNKQINPYTLAKNELANRGLNNKGEWIGFNKGK